METTRTSLLRRVRDTHDAVGWAEFRELYQPLLFGYVHRRGLTGADAEDVVQDVFVRLLRALPSYEHDRSRGRFRTWLWQVVMSAVIDWARTEGRQHRAREAVATLAANATTLAGEPDEDWVTAHRRRILEFAQTQVRANTQPKSWTCYQEYILRGRKCADVGAEVGLTANAVCVNAHRVLARVRDLCQHYVKELADDESPLPG
jgi:RNA polymerase sigma-70 factor (ECF subfamily)